MGITGVSGQGRYQVQTAANDKTFLFNYSFLTQASQSWCMSTSDDVGDINNSLRDIIQALDSASFGWTINYRDKKGRIHHKDVTGLREMALEGLETDLISTDTIKKSFKDYRSNFNDLKDSEVLSPPPDEQESPLAFKKLELLEKIESLLKKKLKVSENWEKDRKKEDLDVESGDYDSDKVEELVGRAKQDKIDLEKVDKKLDYALKKSKNLLNKIESGEASEADVEKLKVLKSKIDELETKEERKKEELERIREKLDKLG
ncbi:MAG: hypothetical protein MUP58_02545 [Candidatus Nanohaloarchaeota archaeon QJJ-9]|nr:hypothetical protein [Candidatus Nanohaloarchaeota archaeon QJJ-9]